MRPCPWCLSLKARRLNEKEGLLQCRSCGAVYWSTPWSEEQVETHYDGYYPPTEQSEYDSITEKRYHAILDQFEQHKSPGRLLDVGCGKGHFLSVAETRGWEAVGCEVSRSALELLSQIKGEKQFNFSVVRSTFTEANFPSGSFDAITLFEVMEHIDDPLSALQETHRLLKKDGILYLTTPNFNSLSRVLLKGRWRVLAEEHRILLNPRAIRLRFHELGFRPFQVTTKNIDVAEILAYWRKGKPEIHPTHPESSSQRLRHRIEGNRLLQQAKAGMNHFLRYADLGDTIQVLAMKEARA